MENENNSINTLTAEAPYRVKLIDEETYPGLLGLPLTGTKSLNTGNIGS